MNNNQICKIISDYHTPLYVFDIKELKSRIKFIRNSLPSEIILCYAIKANTFFLKEICECIDKFEVCSPGELSICLEQGMPAEKLVISGVYKTPDVIEDLLKKDLHIGCYTVESIQQFELLKDLAEKYQHSINLLLRLTSGNQFGLDENDIKRIISDYSKYDYITIKGIQYYSGTQKNSVKRLKREIEYIDSFMSYLNENFGFCVNELEFGPGFPVSYFQSEDIDERVLFEEFSKLLRSMSYKTKITLELGRSIAASCGSYLTSVVDIKTNKEQNYAILDGGIHQLAYFGQFMAMKKPYLEIFPKRNTGAFMDWNFCGSLCTANDILIKQLPVQDLKIGDTIVFKNTGAYCVTEGISLFLSRDLPQVVLLCEDGSITSVREHINTYKLNFQQCERNEK